MRLFNEEETPSPSLGATGKKTGRPGTDLSITGSHLVIYITSFLLDSSIGCSGGTHELRSIALADIDSKY